MNHKIPKRIHIIGSVGSGKTTLAKQLSSTYNVPFYELDNVVRKRLPSGDIRRTDEEKEQYLKSIVHTDTWIIEGVHYGDWVSSSFHHADLIIFLNTKYQIRTYRIIRRFILQKLKLERSNYKPTLEIFFNMFKWNRQYEAVDKPNALLKLAKYRTKTIIVENNKDVIMYLKEKKVLQS